MPVTGGRRRCRPVECHAGIGRWMVKRAVAGPGDPLPGEMVAALGAAAVSRVPPGHFVLLGDNRRQSVDSRVFGFVPGERILGPVRRSASRQEPGTSLKRGCR
jgi:hypothetical protein